MLACFTLIYCHSSGSAYHAFWEHPYQTFLPCSAVILHFFVLLWCHVHCLLHVTAALLAKSCGNGRQCLTQSADDACELAGMRMRDLEAEIKDLRGRHAEQLLCLQQQHARSLTVSLIASWLSACQPCSWKQHLSDRLSTPLPPSCTFCNLMLPMGSFSIKGRQQS